MNKLSLLLNTEKILPVNSYDDFYVSLLEKTSSVVEKKSKSRQALPKINTMLSWGVVKPGDIIVAKGRDDEATLLANEDHRAVWSTAKNRSLRAYLYDLAKLSVTPLTSFGDDTPSSQRLPLRGMWVGIGGIRAKPGNPENFFDIFSIFL